jgi:hypothetical protein
MYSLNKLPNQLQGEKAVALYRRHWFTLFISVIFYIFLGMILPFIFFILDQSSPDLFTNDLAYALAVIILSIYYLSLTVFLFNEFLDFYLDLWIITTERVLAIEQKGLFARVISEQKLTRIQDVTSEVKGIFATVLHYGNVTIQTAGEEQRFIFKNVPAPVTVAKLLNDEVTDCKIRHHEPV